MKKPTIPTIAISLAVFVLSALVSHGVFANRAEEAPADAPPAPELVGVAAPFQFSGDAVTAAQRWVDEDLARRTWASAEDIPLDVHEYYAPADDIGDPGEAANPAPPESGPSEDLPSAEEDAGEVPWTPSGDSTPEGDGIIDLCAGGESAELCPDGVGGTVLFALDAMPPFDGMVTARPHHPGTAPYPYYPECEPQDLAPGAVQIGITVNRPANIDVAFYAPGEDGWAAREIGLSTATSDAAWLEWFTSDDAEATDPEQWIHVCHVVTGLNAGTYDVQATFTDAADAELSFVYPRDFPLTLVVRGGDAATADQARRPTVVLPIHVDRVLVNAALNSDQWLSMRAVKLDEGWRGSDASCASDYSEISGSLGADTIYGIPLHREEIPRETREAPGYPYLPEQDITLTHEFFLEEGTDYTICVYWLDGRGTETEPRIVAVEAIPFSTPEAYRVDLEVISEHDTWGALNGSDVVSAEVFAIRPAGLVGGFSSQCGPAIGAGFTGTAGAIWMPADRKLCEGLTGVASIKRYGIPVYTELSGLGEHTYSGETRVRVNPMCDGECVPRAPEMVMIPLPEVPTERRMCGTGFGGDCGEVPMRSAGNLSLLVTYTHTEGNGLNGFRIGEPRYGDTGPGTPDLPYLEVDAVQADQPTMIAIDRGVTVDLNVSLFAEESMQVRAQVLPGDPGDELCTVGTPHAARSLVLEPDGARGTYPLRGLCAGESYRVVFTDAAGTPVPVWGDIGWTPSTSHEFRTDMIEVTVRGRILAARNYGYRELQTGYSTLEVSSPHSPGDYGDRIDANMTADHIETYADAGWVFTEDGYSACRGYTAATHYAKPYEGTILVAHGQPIQIRGNATFRVNLSDEVTGEPTCTPNPSPGYAGNNSTSMDVWHTLTIDELMDGVTLEWNLEPEVSFIKVELKGS